MANKVYDYVTQEIIKINQNLQNKIEVNQSTL